MKKYFTLNTIVIFIYILFIEFIIKLLTESSILNFSIIRIMIGSMLISMFFNIILMLFKKKKSKKIFNIVLVVFIGIFDFIQFGLYNYLGFFMGIGNSEQGTKVLSYILDFLKAIRLVHLLLLVPLVLVLIYYIFFENKVIHKYKVSIKVGKKQVKYVSLVFVCLSLFYYLLIRFNVFQDKLQVESNYYLWIYPENSNLSVNNFGVNMYFFSDIKSYIFKVDEETALNYYFVEKEKNNVNKDGWRSISDEEWTNINDNTTDDNYKLLNNYFMNRGLSRKNEMTGIFEGKNVILILMESINDVGVLNKEYFPNLYMLYNDGISFRNNFSPRNNCSTGNNELTVLTSMFTINNTCAANIYKDNTYFNAAFNMFKNNGYYASAFHNYSLMYYNRDEYMPKLGAEEYYGAKELGIHVTDVYGDWPEDDSLFINSRKHYMDKDKFFTYFITVSSHQTYNVSSPTGDKYLDKYKKLGYSDDISRYLSKTQILDEALGVLIQQLKDQGKFEDTVLVLFGDHYPYGLTDKALNEYFKKNDYKYTVSRNSTDNKNADRTPFIIYNSEIEPRIVEDYTTIIDILPTMLNMFNIEYDSRLYMGCDIFSVNHVSRSVFADGSWQDENAFYYAPSNKITYYGKKKYTENEIKNINVEINQRQKMSSLVLKTNYFNYLENELRK